MDCRGLDQRRPDGVEPSVVMTTYQAADRGPRQRILVVDDEPEIRDFITRALVADGYAADAACDGADGLRQSAEGRYALIILDLVMPETDGRSVLATLHRDRPEQAVIVLSCVSDVDTKVTCLDLGAKDYLTKPFALGELLARVRVQLRHEHGHEHQLHEVLKAGELMEHAGQSVGKNQLLATVWGIDFDPGSNVVDVCIRRLRSKLGFDLIETVRGAGYRLAS